LVTYIEGGTQEEGVGEWGVEDIWAWDEVTGEWRRLQKEERCDLYSTDIWVVVKSRRMRWLCM
jgi:hypothetical protein